MNGRTPEETVTAYAAAWERGDTDSAFSFYAPDVVMHLPGRGTLAGDHIGKDAVIAAIHGLLDRTDDASALVEVIDRLSSPDRVAMLLREVVTRDGEVLDLRRINTYRVTDGLIREIDVFEAHQYDVDSFFG